MKKIKMFECIVDDGKSIYKEVLPSKNKKELLETWGGNGTFEKITDVTELYYVSLNAIMDKLNSKFGVAEQRLIQYILNDYENVINDI